MFANFWAYRLGIVSAFLAFFCFTFGSLVLLSNSSWSSVLLWLGYGAVTGHVIFSPMNSYPNKGLLTLIFSPVGIRIWTVAAFALLLLSGPLLQFLMGAILMLFNAPTALLALKYKKRIGTVS